MATLELESARVLPDGRIVRVAFTTRTDLGSHGNPDWLPAWANGARLNITSTGTGTVALEPLGIQSVDWNMPQPALGQSTGGTIPAGKYYLRVAFVNGSNQEVYLSAPGGNWGSDPWYPLAITATGGRKITLRFPMAVPAGMTARIYGSTFTDPASTYGDPLTMRLLRSGIPAGTLTYDLTDYTFADADKAPDGLRCWSTTWLVTGPNAVAKEEAVTLDGPAGLWSDRFGNVSGAVSSVAAENLSRVAADGFTADYTPDAVVHVAANGNNANPGTSPAAPKATVAAAFNTLPSYKSFTAIRVRRGDTFVMPNKLNLRAGVDGQYHKPLILEDYWNPADGPDPGVRPVLDFGDFSCLNIAGGISGGFENILFRRIEFKANTAAGAFGWGDTPARNVMISDCTFNNANISVQHQTGPTRTDGLTIHRSIVKDAQVKKYGDHTSGIFCHGVDNLLISQTVVDYCGWTDPAFDAQGPRRWNQNQNIYIQHSTVDSILWGGLNLRAAGAGCQMRGGGTAARNLFWMCDTSLGTIFRSISCTRNAVIDNDSIGWSYDLNKSDGLIDTHGTIEFCIDANHATDQGQALRVINGAEGYRREFRVRHNTFKNTFQGLTGGMNGNTERIEVSRNIIGPNAAGKRLFSINIGAAASWSAWASDYNVWVGVGSTPFQPQQAGVGSPVDFAGYKSVTGQDANSVLLTTAPTYGNGSWSVADFSAGRGGPATAAGWLDLVRNRPPGVWGPLYDGGACYDDAAAAYTPIGLPAIDANPFGFYGPRDYRGTSYTILSLGPLTAGQASSFSVPPSGVSNDTLTLSDQGAGGQFTPSTLTWSNDALPRSFQYIPAGPGLVTLELRAADSVVAWIGVRFGARGGVERFRRRALRGGISSGLD
jgi:hypothetical protein